MTRDKLSKADREARVDLNATAVRTKLDEGVDPPNFFGKADADTIRRVLAADPGLHTAIADYMRGLASTQTHAPDEHEQIVQRFNATLKGLK